MSEAQANEIDDLDRYLPTGALDRFVTEWGVDGIGRPITVRQYIQKLLRKERLRGAMDELYNADVDRLDKATFDRRMSDLTAQLEKESSTEKGDL